MQVKISIVIVTYQRTSRLERCLKSILESNPGKDWEVVIVVNGNDEKTLNFLNQFVSQRLNFTFFAVPRTTNSQARNFALEKVSGEIIYFLDDDVIVKKNIFQTCLEKFKTHPEVDIIGGPNLTPPESSFFQKCSGYLLSSSFGAAKVRWRYLASGEDRLVDDKSLILCNLVLRKSIIEREKKLFNEEILCNEENLLLEELKCKGYKMLYSPDLIVYHDRRKDLKSFLEQFFKYGRGRGQMTRLMPGSLSFFFVLPILFLVDLISLMFFHSLVFFFPLFTYLILDLFSAIFISFKQRDIGCAPLLIFLFPCAHISYGLGFLYGLLK